MSLNCSTGDPPLFNIKGAVAENCIFWLASSILLGRHWVGDFAGFSLTDDPVLSDGILLPTADLSFLEEFCLSPAPLLASCAMDAS
jgi:hypothetical protein